MVPTPFRILVVDADPDFALPVTKRLEAAGFETTIAADGDTAIAQAAAEAFALILMDVVPPFRHALEVCRELRARGVSTPVLMLSPFCAVDVKVWAFKSGADDYMTKPLDFAELLARIEALLRRAGAAGGGLPFECRFGEVAVNFRSGRTFRAGQEVHLSVTELRLLRYLAGRRDTPVSREELLSAVWGRCEKGSRTLDVHISSLRQKLETDPRAPRHIRTARGVGYFFSD